jgi:cyclohexadienyl dehydratase
MRSLPRLLLFVVLSFIVSAPNWAAAQTDPASQRVFDLIAERLRLMPLVAIYKLHEDKPIEDLAREAVVLEDAATVAERNGFDQERARRFFQVQIEAAKVIQRYAQTALLHQPPSQWPPAPSLTEQIRPELNRLSAHIISALSEVKIAGFDLPRSAYQSTLAEFELSEGLKDELFIALQTLLTEQPRYDNTVLTTIRQSGTLRIGTTGDYAPFSFSNLDGQLCKISKPPTVANPEANSTPTDTCALWSDSLEGIDIALGESLANYLGFELEWIPTSWPTLMTDLREHKFDVAMSGISITPQRLAQAAFSAPYHEGGKIPVGHCSLKSRFQSMVDIDQASTRVIVNPGGTNEQFARRILKHASISLHQDNRTIFDELTSQNADVMFTDYIEARLKTKQIPDLCLFLPQALSYQEKGVLIQPDSALISKVNEWLASRSTQTLLQELWRASLGADYPAL